MRNSDCADCEEEEHRDARRGKDKIVVCWREDSAFKASWSLLPGVSHVRLVVIYVVDSEDDYRWACKVRKGQRSW